MGSWGYVLLAYGVVWSAVLLYFASLKYRVRKVEEEIRLRANKGYNDHDEKK